MSLLKVENLTHSFADKILYKNVDLELYKNEHAGIVGRNGTGKSTLIQLLTGLLTPEEGNICWQNCQIGYLDQYALLDTEKTILEYLHKTFQDLYDLETKMIDLYTKADDKSLQKAYQITEQLEFLGFYQLDQKIAKVIHGLGLASIGENKTIKTLSGGQRAKVILAKLLLKEPDVLLLDEPTNFLDQKNIEWLADYLIHFKGAFLVVSHDFAFLNQITNTIFHIEFETIHKYHGNYQSFLKQKAHLEEDYERRYQSQQKQIAKTEAYIRKNIAGSNSKMAKGRRKQLERMDVLAKPNHHNIIKMKFLETFLSGNNTLVVKDLVVGYNYPLLDPFNFTLRRGEKLVIKGFNGIGKTTLMKTLVGQIPLLKGNIHFHESVVLNYYAQDFNWSDDTKTPLEILSDWFIYMDEQQIRTALARIGLKDTNVMQPVKTLSGGEQSKVKLLRLLLTPCNVLLLDEPTNHFDEDTKKAFKKALQEFEGSILLVSHDPTFYEDWADRILTINKK